MANINKQLQIVLAVLLIYCRSASFIVLPQFQNVLTPEQRETLVETFKICVESLQTLGTKNWFLDGGGLLGFYRHNGHLIPWDDDLDLAIIQNSENITQSILEDFEMKLNQIFEQKFGHFRAFAHVASKVVKVFSLSPIATKTLENFPEIRWPYVDLVFYQTRNQVISWRQAAYEVPLSWIQPLRNGTFENMTIPVPNDTLRYLKLLYGDLKKCIPRGFDHSKHRLFEHQPSMPCRILGV